MTLGEKLAGLRKEKNITQEQMAEKLGVTRQTISKWELDQSKPDLQYIRDLSDFFQVTLDYLIKDEEKKLFSRYTLPNIYPCPFLNGTIKYIQHHTFPNSTVHYRICHG